MGDELMALLERLCSKLDFGEYFTKDNPRSCVSSHRSCVPGVGTHKPYGMFRTPVVERLGMGDWQDGDLVVGRGEPAVAVAMLELG